MTTAELRLLGVFLLEFLTDTIEQGDVALLWILFQGGDEGPGHGARGLPADGSILTVGEG